MSFVGRISCPQASHTVTLPFVLEMTFPSSTSLSSCELVMAVLKGLMVKNKFSWVHQLSKRFHQPASCEGSPIRQLCCSSSGTSISVTVPKARVIVSCSFHYARLV